MKTTAAILLLALGLFFMQASKNVTQLSQTPDTDALKCRQSSCVGTRPCTSRTVTCADDVKHCFVLIKSSPTIIMTRGCIKEANCQIMKAYEPSTRCCTTDLCN